jgi:alkylation response protein AidB-like acyl-CoA dehydrogenase
MFERDTDQELLEETTRRFLESEASTEKLRLLAGTDAGFDYSYWRQGAELGWTSLLVAEEAGGGSISGDGVLDLMLLVYQFGLHASPGPLGPTNLVAGALDRWGSAEQKADALAKLMTGEEVGSWALAEPAPNDAFGTVTVEARRDGGSFVLNGIKRPVEAASEAGYILVVARLGDGLAQLLVPRGTPGVAMKPLRGLDMTRRYAEVRFDEVRLPLRAVVGEPGTAASAVEWLVDLAVVMQVAEMVGAMQWAFDTTLEWVFNRYSFGRPLASYQAIKHRFADMKTWLEASYAIAGAAARAVQDDPSDRSETVSSAKFYVGRQGGELLQDCIQLHGGVGVTFAHDLHIFLRRVATNIPTYGNPREHAARIGRALEARGDG